MKLGKEVDVTYVSWMYWYGMKTKSPNRLPLSRRSSKDKIYTYTWIIQHVMLKEEHPKKKTTNRLCSLGFPYVILY